MSYETVSKVRAADGSLHDSVEAAQRHDTQRKKEDRARRVKNDMIDLVGLQLYCANSLPRGWGDKPYNDDGRLPTHEDIADFILDQWVALAAVRQHL